ncbi:fibroblast growth factor 23-like isoform 1-T2 [Synchiropus picturatus]
MQLAAFSLLLTVVHVSVPRGCKARIPDPEEQMQVQQKRRDSREESSGGIGRFTPEVDVSIRKGFHKEPLVILPIRTDTSNVVSIFGLKGKEFLCMDSNGELYYSRNNHRDECLFGRIRTEPSEVFHSLSAGRLLRLQGMKRRAGQKKSPKAPRAVLKRLFGGLIKRKRRSEEVNPSDPLRSEPDPSHQDPDLRQPDQDQAGSMSKETLTSCDDPLKVLQPSAPESPVKTNIADRAQGVTQQYNNQNPD